MARAFRADATRGVEQKMGEKSKKKRRKKSQAKRKARIELDEQQGVINILEGATRDARDEQRGRKKKRNLLEKKEKEKNLRSSELSGMGLKAKLDDGRTCCATLGHAVSLSQTTGRTARWMRRGQRRLVLLLLLSFSRRRVPRRGGAVLGHRERGGQQGLHRGEEASGTIGVDRNRVVQRLVPAQDQGCAWRLVTISRVLV